MKNLLLIETNLRMPLMILPVRSVLVRLPNAEILISPGSQMTSQQIAECGTVTDLIAPNLFHGGGVRHFLDQKKVANVWAPSGFENRQRGELFNKTLGVSEWSFEKELQLIKLEGMPRVNEFLFVHRESRSLIVTDLCFNLIESSGIGAWIILHIFGTYKKLAMSKLFASQIKDRQAFQQSMNELMTHDFDNLIVSHGVNILGDAKQKLKMVFQERGF